MQIDTNWRGPTMAILLGRYIVQLIRSQIEDQPSHLPIRMPELSSSRLRA